MRTTYQRFMRQPREPQREFVVACPQCGEVIGLRMGGERIPDAIHICAEEEGRRADDPTAS